MGLPMIPGGPPDRPIPPAVGSPFGGPPEQPGQVLNDPQQRASSMMNLIMQVDTMIEDAVRQFPELAEGARKYMDVQGWLTSAVQSPNISGSQTPNPRIPG